ncbi:MAG TPA: NADH-quinone oxidoreductase subunit N [Deltaproteobacteria bacterium]|nr:NADH-quinone oxidoreductase subunit N [Deltaproteobacteria bacterium]
MNWAFSQPWSLSQFVGVFWPALILLGAGLLGLLTVFLPKERRLGAAAGIAGLGFLAAALAFFQKWQAGEGASLGLLLSDPYANFFALLISLIGFGTTLFSFSYWKAQEEALLEAFSLILFAAFGMVTMVMTTHLVTFVFGLEIMSLSLYVLVGLRRHDPRSGEAAFKYFLLGSVATAFLLFGVSLLYGATGTLDWAKFSSDLVQPELGTFFKLGALLVLLGFAFKVAAAPFHFWAPDAYDGAPMPVTGFMAAGVKVAAFGALLRVVAALTVREEIPLAKWLVALSLATMVVGNLTALRQGHLKRLMAYSSIAHAGYLLLGVATLPGGAGFSAHTLSPVLFYLAVYSLLTLGVFAVLTMLSSQGEEINRLADLDGLAERRPVLAAALSVFLISLAGIPPSAGFLAKYYLFSQAMKVGLYLPAILGILTSAVSLYYYLGPVVRMYFHVPQPRADFAPGGRFRALTLAFMVALVFYLGLVPGSVLQSIRSTEWRMPATDMARDISLFISY